MLLNILDAAGDLKVSSVTSRGVNWGTLSDTQFLISSGEAVGTDGRKCLWDVMAGRVSSQGTFTEVYIKMSKLNGSMYEPFEISLRYPLEADPKAHWSTVWADAFKIQMAKFVRSQASDSVTLSEALRVLRMCELTQSSLEQQGLRINEPKLQQSKAVKKWITLASDAGINGDALMSA